MIYRTSILVAVSLLAVVDAGGAVLRYERAIANARREFGKSPLPSQGGEVGGAGAQDLASALMATRVKSSTGSSRSARAAT